MRLGDQQEVSEYLRSGVPDINTCLELSDAELLSLLFEHASPEHRTIEVPIPEPGSQYETILFMPLAEAPWPQNEKGQFLLDRVMHQIIKKYICLECRYYEKHFSSNFKDTVKIISFIANILSPLELGLPLNVVATLLVRLGLENICHVDRKFSSFEEYLCSLLRYPTSPLFVEAIKQFSTQRLSLQTCECIFLTASSLSISQSDAARLLSILLEYPPYRDKALKALLDVLFSCTKEATRSHTAEKIIVRTLMSMGSSCVSELSKAIYELAQEWEKNRNVISILCGVLGAIGDKRSLTILKFALQKRQEELENWKCPMKEDDPWFFSYTKVLKKIGMMSEIEKK
jgi:hypothetical protein